MASTAKLLTIQGGKCFYCGEKLTLEEATIDHVIPKALGGDNTEGNAVVCCRAINQALGSATPKEKLTAVINADGKLECPSRLPQKTNPPTVAVEKSMPKPLATAERKASELNKTLRESFQAASAMNGGEKALLSAVGSELRKRIPEFAVKKYGVRTFGKLVETLGYRVNKMWCYSK